MLLAVIEDEREPIAVHFKHGHGDFTEPCAADKNMVFIPTFDYSSSIYINEVVKRTADECIVDVHIVESNAEKKSKRYIFHSLNGTVFLHKKHIIPHTCWMNRINGIPDMIKNPYNTDIHQYLPEGRETKYCTDRVMAANRMTVYVWLQDQWVRYKEDVELHQEILDEVHMVINMLSLVDYGKAQIYPDEFHRITFGNTRAGKTHSAIRNLVLPPLEIYRLSIESSPLLGGILSNGNP